MNCNHMICAGSACMIAAPPTDILERVHELERELTARRLVELERGRLVASLDAFVRWAWRLMTGAPFVPNAMTDQILATLQRVGTTPAPHRILIAMPPGVGKSTLLACYSAWRLARDASHRALHIGHASDLAATESRRVRRLVEGDEFRAMFGHVVLRVDENTSTLWATTANGLYLAAGVDSGVLGRRAFEAILDDPLHGNDRWSTTAKQKLVEFFFGTLVNRLDGEGTIIVCQQRLAKDDLIGCLAEVAGWQLISLPAEDADGNLLAPNILSREKLDELRTASPSNYACMFLQNPSDDSTATVPRTWWRFHRADHVRDDSRPSGCDQEAPPLPTPDKFDACAIVMDPTFGGTKRTNDYAVIQCWGARGTRTGKTLLYLRHQWRKRATQREQRDALRAVMRMYPEAKAYVEKAAAGAGLIEELIADGIPVEPLQPLGSKETRLGIYALTPIEEGRVLLPLGATYVPELVEEMAGGSGHDDAMDCVVYACAILGQGKSPWGTAGKPSVWGVYRDRKPGSGMANVASALAGHPRGNVRENVTTNVLPGTTSDQRKQAQLEHERARRVVVDRAEAGLHALLANNKKRPQ